MGLRTRGRTVPRSLRCHSKVQLHKSCKRFIAGHSYLIKPVLVRVTPRVLNTSQNEIRKSLKRIEIIYCLLRNTKHQVAREMPLDTWKCSAERLGANVYDTTERQSELGAEQRLWTAVIARSVEEWVSGPLRSQREAETYLFSDQNDFPKVCRAAGMNPEALRTKLEKLKKSGAGPAKLTLAHA